MPKKYLELKFTEAQIEQLISQGDAKMINSRKELVIVYRNLYKREERETEVVYFHVEQRLKS